MLSVMKAGVRALTVSFSSLSFLDSSSSANIVELGNLYSRRKQGRMCQTILNLNLASAVCHLSPLRVRHRLCVKEKAI